MSRDKKDEHEQNSSDKSLKAERDQEKLDIATAYRDAASGSESTGLSNGRMGNQATSQILAKGQQKNSRKNGETITKLKLMLDRMDEIQRELQKQYDHVNEQLRVAAELKNLIASGNYDPNNPLHQMMLDFIGYPEEGRDQLTARSMDDHIEVLEERRGQIVERQRELDELRQVAVSSELSDSETIELIEQNLSSIEKGKTELLGIEKELEADVLPITVKRPLPKRSEKEIKKLSDEEIKEKLEIKAEKEKKEIEKLEEKKEDNEVFVYNSDDNNSDNNSDDNDKKEGEEVYVYNSDEENKDEWDDLENDNNNEN